MKSILSSRPLLTLLRPTRPSRSLRRSRPQWTDGLAAVTFWTLFPADAAVAIDSVDIIQPLSFALRPLLFIGQSLMLIRIVVSWFPEIKETEVPWIFAYVPTEPILSVTRKIIPPAFGVDISPVVWIAVLSFAGEILIGPQGILNLIQRSS